MEKKILILAANPRNTNQLRLDEEVREIEEGLKRAKNRDTFVVHQKWAVRAKDVRRALLDIEPHIVHFCGHGETSGLVLENELGNAVEATNNSLKNLFELFDETIEVVVLNSCYSENQAVAISEHINFVVGMNSAIGDKAAIEFAIGFYDAIGAGKNYEQAFRFGCNSIELNNIKESHKPIIHKKAKNSISDIPEIKTEKVQLIFEGDKSKFDKISQQKLTKILAAVLEMDAEHIKILNVQTGSIKVTIEVPSEKEEKLSEVLNTMFEKDFIPLINESYSFAFMLCNEDRESAEDLVQDTYIQLYQFLAKNFTPNIENPKSFLYVLMKNVHRNKYQRKQIEEDRKKIIQASTEDIGRLSFNMDDDKKQIGDEITNAINEMPSGLKAVLLMSDVENFSYEEISQILDIPIGTVRSRLHRARSFLKANLKDYAKSLGYNTDNQ